MSDEIRKRFCVRCSRLVQPEDVRAVELQGNAGAMCGDDVDKLIVSIWTPDRGGYPNAPLPARMRPNFKLPGEPRGEFL